MSRNRIIVDADPVLYRAGFAAQQTHYEVTFVKDGVTEVRNFHSDPRDEIKIFKNNGWEVAKRDSWVVPGDVRKGELAAYTQIKAILEHCREHLGTDNAAMEVILSGTGNFRNDIATILEYKGRRKLTEKPVHYQHIREYVINGPWDVRVVDGREADDEVAIRMTECRNWGTPAILATIDKDLDQIPGWHYDYKNHVFYEVDDTEATVLFYAQVLCGDPTDDIPGLIGLGPQRSKKLALEWHATWDESEHELSLDAFLWDMVRLEYAKRGIKGYDGDPDAAALEVARLVWLQRFPGQIWEPEKV